MTRMRKSWRSVLALLLCALSLSACTAGAAKKTETASRRDPFSRPALTEPASTETGTPRFDELVYERPDLDELDRLIAAAEEALRSDGGVEACIEALDACYAFSDRYDTMYTLADIRNCQDQTDPYFAAELKWCAENDSQLDRRMDALYYACAASAYAAQLEESYFWEGFTEQYGDESESVYSDRYVELLRQESALIAEYRALSADPTIEYRGSERSVYELMETLDGEAYNDAVRAYYRKYNEDFADLYIRLMAVREQMAGELGYESYEQMQYRYGFDRDYTPGQAERYLEDIRIWIVPLYRELKERGIYDEVWENRIDGDFLLELIGTAAQDFGGSVEEAFAFMTGYGYYDVRVDRRKADMSFQCYLKEPEAPFLFLDAEGYTPDILNLAHEFGHYCEAYVNENAYESVDLAEVYSQAMEYLILTRLGELLYDEDVENIARTKMLDTVDLYVEQSAYAQFEHEVYALGSERLDAGTLNAVARRTAEQYGFYDADYDEFYSMSWIGITHFFEYPFYVVSYPVSNDAAMQLFEMERAEEGRGTDRYLSVLERDFGSLSGLIDAGGLQSPFAPGRVQAIAALIRAVCLEE